MLAINHALGGAIIGLSVSNPALAVPLAFVSHFVLDCVPHFDPPGDELARIGRPAFRLQLIADATLCFLLVVFLALSKPKDWMLAAVCAFVATSPDLFWIPKFISAQRSGKLLPNSNWFWRMHHNAQWCTGPQLWWVEALWFVSAGTVVIFLAA